MAAKTKASAQVLGAEQSQKLDRLLAGLRQRRLLNETSQSDFVVVMPPEGATREGVEVQAVSAINLGNASRLLGGRSFGAAPKMTVVGRLDSSLVVKANSSALQAMRFSSPGLRIFAATYLYAQYIRPMGEEMDSAEVQIAAGAKVKTFSVQLTDTAGSPLQGIKTKALVDWDGAHISSVSDADGLAKFSVPLVYPRIEVIMVEPEHTYWSRYVKGFERVAAPEILPIQLDMLVPDSYELLKHYGPYDAQAGAGVTVGVIDCGVGPHAALAVAGGACLVTGESPVDFQDNGLGHGTHVAGIIAARPAGAINAYGLAPACTLLAYRVCPKTGELGRARSTDVAAAIERAIADRCDFVNISMGSVEAMPEVPAMLLKARDAGVVVIAATGNDGQEQLRYPARYSHSLAAGAMGRDETFPKECPESFQESEIRRGKEFVAEFSNYGLGTDFIGPGVAVVSTFPKNRYAMMSGTSMATPFATGMAARLLSRDEALLNMARDANRADAIIRMLSQSARKMGWSDKYSGFGVLQ